MNDESDRCPIIVPEKRHPQTGQILREQRQCLGQVAPGREFCKNHGRGTRAERTIGLRAVGSTRDKSADRQAQLAAIRRAFETGRLTKTGSRFGAFEMSFPVNNGYFVYCLLDAAMRPTYIGQTVNVWRRISEHVKSGKDIMHVRVFACESKAHMDELERELIRAFQPPLNTIMYEAA
jgi:GIY-YIG catalytic domain